MKDQIFEAVLKVIKKAKEPLETKEITGLVSKTIKDVTRTKLFYRLLMLMSQGLIKGKFVGPGKGVWIWWKKGVFEKNLDKGTWKIKELESGGRAKLHKHNEPEKLKRQYSILHKKIQLVDYLERLDKAYKRGVIDHKGYWKTKNSVIKKINKLGGNKKI